MVDQTTKGGSGSGSSKPSSSQKGTSRGMIASLESKYEKFIEFGKRKLHYYDPGVSDNDRFLMSFLIYFMFLLMVVFTADYLAQKTYEDSDSLGPLQHLEVEIVYQVQHDYFDMPVYVNRTSKTIWYDTTKEWNGQNLTKDERVGGFGLQIDSVCTGFHEMVFLGVLVMGFRGVSVKLRAKWTVILLGIVFVENLFRIFALYPMALYWGRDFEEWFHHYWWHYGQYAFIMALFALWFFFVARKQIGPSDDEKKEEKGSKEEKSSKETTDETDEKEGKEEEGSKDDKGSKDATGSKDEKEGKEEEGSKDDKGSKDTSDEVDENELKDATGSKDETDVPDHEGGKDDETTRDTVDGKEDIGDGDVEKKTDNGDVVKEKEAGGDEGGEGSKALPENDEPTPQFLPDDPELEQKGTNE